MDLKSIKKGTELTVTLSGELNTITARDLAAFLDAELPGASSLTLDFAGCDFVSSAGLRVLLGNYKKLKAEGKSMRLTNVGKNFRDVLTVSNLITVFDIE